MGMADTAMCIGVCTRQILKIQYVDIFWIQQFNTARSVYANAHICVHVHECMCGQEGGMSVKKTMMVKKI